MQRIAQEITGWLLSLSSYSGVLFVYWAINDIPFMQQPAIIKESQYAVLSKYAVMLLALLLLSRAALWLAIHVFKPGDTLKSAEIRPIEGVAIPTYIGLFVIALELSDADTYQATGLLVALFLLWRLFERIFYFNPIWLLFGYRFYEVKTQRSNTITLITKRSNLKGIIDLDQLREINKYTYLEEKVNDSSS